LLVFSRILSERHQRSLSLVFVSARRGDDCEFLGIALRALPTLLDSEGQTFLVEHSSGR
jgi:hypothetical protein